MTDFELYSEFQSLPEHLKKEAKLFLSFLKNKVSASKKKNKRKFGAMKGRISLSKDFDAPVADFNDYMQ